MLSELLRRQVLSTFPRGRSGIDYQHPRGDPGLFGPGSVTWRVHADFCSMLSGGLCALLLQTLHPRALAGVYDHSRFREDLIGRLRRTTNFVAGTSFAPAAEAQKLIARVRRIHDQVHGHTADGMAYAANDPDLLTWVHMTESFAFLQGYHRYGPLPLTTALTDRYYAEVAQIAQALGATQVPTDSKQASAYFAAQQQHLRYDTRSAEVLQVLERIRLPVLFPGAARALFLGAATALLPEWAQRLLPMSRQQRLRARASDALLRQLAPRFRAALPDGIAALACARVGLTTKLLARWPDQGAAGQA